MSFAPYSVVTAVDDEVRGAEALGAGFTDAGFGVTIFFGGAAFALVAVFCPATAFEAVLDAPFELLLPAVFATVFAAFLATTFVGFDFAVALLGTLSSGVNERRETTSIELGSDEVWGGPSQRGRH
ncbi:MAG: hypothetical protein ACKOI2_15075 [Actinomycetota bacterium]